MRPRIPNRYHRPVTEQDRVAIRPARADDADRIAGLLTEEGYPAGPSDLASRLKRFERADSAVLVADALAGGSAFVHLAVEVENQRATRLCERLGFAVVGEPVPDLLLA